MAQKCPAKVEYHIVAAAPPMHQAFMDEPFLVLRGTEIPSEGGVPYSRSTAMHLWQAWR